MTRPVDHVTVAGPDLSRLREAFEDAGLATEYGGEHDNGVTHMAVLGFEDRSYVELIAKRADGHSPWWDREIDGAAGPCAWCVPADDLASEVTRLREAGFSVDGPTAMSRERPDGEVARWRLAAVESGTLGAPFPMVIADETPLDRRVTVTVPASETGLSGLSRVVLGTTDLTGPVEEVGRFFDAAPATVREEPSLGARVAAVPGTPVSVAAPLGDGWLADRVSGFDGLPCAFLFEVTDADAVRDSLAVSASTPWGEGRAHWLDVDLPGRYGAYEV